MTPVASCIDRPGKVVKPMVLKSLWYTRRDALRQRWAVDLEQPGARPMAVIDMNFLDHGILRRFWKNHAQLDRGVYRSNQPGPYRIRKLAKEGLRTIINLRGPNGLGSYALEREACAKHGIKLINFRLGSRRLPSAQEVADLKEIFETAERPLLFHCKSGADRAGLAAALYILAVKNGSAEEAAAQLSLKFLHIKSSETGILDRMVETYGVFNAKMPTPFMEWIEKHYDPEAIIAGFTAKSWAKVLVDSILRRE